jgi:predicted kinase
MDGSPDRPPEQAPLLVLVTGPPGTGKSTVSEAIAQKIGGSVLSHDWAMSGLRPYGEIQAVLDGMDPSGHRVVGWSILQALARSQIRNGRSVVLDGVARSPEIARCEAAARSEGAHMMVIATHCTDRDVHRSRVEGRQRSIPDWYELEWSGVAQSLTTWEVPDRAELVLDSAAAWEENAARIDALLRSRSPRAPGAPH